MSDAHGRIDMKVRSKRQGRPQPAAGAPGAQPGRGMGRGPALRSAEILEDQRVTFRLRAPNAADVMINGDLLLTFWTKINQKR